MMRAWACSLLLLACLAPAWCGAIDNPEAPDYVAAFEARADRYEAEIARQSGRTGEVASAYGAYERFLDGELNRAYKSLLDRLAPQERKLLVASQREWVRFRQAEFGFIGRNWTPERFGSSYALSRGGYRTSLVKTRVVQLLHYLKNYRD